MTTLSFSIDEGKLQSAVHEAILAQLDADTRARIIRDAIGYLTTPTQRGNWGPTKSPIQWAFEEALQVKVRELANDFVRDDPAFALALRTHIEAAAAAAIADSDRLKSVITKSIVSAIDDLRERGED